MQNSKSYYSVGVHIIGIKHWSVFKETDTNQFTVPFSQNIYVAAGLSDARL